MGIARSALLNLIGLAAPLPLAILVVPGLLDGLGNEGFALLTMCWALSAYTSVFDLGLGRALTQKLAVELTHGEGGSPSVGALCSTALLSLAGLGCVVGLTFYAAAAGLVGWLRLESAQQPIAVAAFGAMAMAIPFVVLSAGFRGVLEARHAFGRVNAVRLPLGLWTLGGPWLAMQSGADLEGIAWTLWGGRVLATAAWGWMAWQLLPAWRQFPRPSARWLQPLLRTGSWLTVGNLVGPLMGYADRFLVAALVSTAAAAYYATPQELVSKLWVLPGALMAVMFPTLARHLATQDPAAGKFCAVALNWILLACLPLALGLGLGAQELLELWLGPTHASASSAVLRWMALGMFLGCVAQLPFTLLQSGDGAAVTAKLHLVQLPCFLLCFVLAAHHAGIAGAAAVWALRNGLDALCLFWLSHRRYPQLQLWSTDDLWRCALAVTAFSGVLIEPAGARLVWWLFCCGGLLALLLIRPAPLRFPRA